MRRVIRTSIALTGRYHFRIGVGYLFVKLAKNNCDDAVLVVKHTNSTWAVQFPRGKKKIGLGAFLDDLVAFGIQTYQWVIAVQDEDEQ